MSKQRLLAALGQKRVAAPAPVKTRKRERPGYTIEAAKQEADEGWRRARAAEAKARSFENRFKEAFTKQ